MQLLFKKNRVIILIVLILLLATWIAYKVKGSSSYDFKVICFKAGKADAFLLESQEGNVLIDTGLDQYGKKIVDYLDDHDIKSIDYLIITHFDKDHVGGADTVIKKIQVKNVLQPVYQKDSDDVEDYTKALKDQGITPEKLTQDYYFSLGKVDFCVNPPQEEEYDTSESNNSSLITSVTYGKTSFLFTGDAEDERLEEYMAMDSSSYTFLKVPYHGNYQSILPEFFQTVKPEYAVITSSKDEKEDNETVQALNDVGCKVYYTRKGEVTVSSNGKTLKIEQ